MSLFPTVAVPFGRENGKSRLQQAQEDVEEVKHIMLDNLKKADERSGKLEDLEDRADQLLAKVPRCYLASAATLSVRRQPLESGRVLLESLNTRLVELLRKTNGQFTS